MRFSYNIIGQSYFIYNTYEFFLKKVHIEVAFLNVYDIMAYEKNTSLLIKDG